MHTLRYMQLSGLSKFARTSARKLKQIAHEHVIGYPLIGSLVPTVSVSIHTCAWLCHALLTYLSILTFVQWPYKFMLTQVLQRYFKPSKAFMFCLPASPLCNECRQGRYWQNSKEVTSYIANNNTKGIITVSFRVKCSYHIIHRQHGFRPIKEPVRNE